VPDPGRDFAKPEGAVTMARRMRPGPGVASPAVAEVGHG